LYDADPATIWFEYYRGFIYHRKDTKRNIKAPFDWRNVWYARYSSQGVYPSWTGRTQYSTGQVVLGEDGWLYMALSPSNGQNPTRYDSYNQPYATDIAGESMYVWGDPRNGLDSVLAPPTNAFAPMSMRRAWLRLWPETYKWYSPWANKPVGGLLVHQLFIGNANLRYKYGASSSRQNFIAQPILGSILADGQNPHFVRPISGEDDSITWSIGELSTDYWDTIRDIDFGTKSTIYLDVLDRPVFNEAGQWADPFSKRWIQGKDENRQIGADVPGELGYINPKGSSLFSYVNDNRLVYESYDPRALRPPVDQGPIEIFGSPENPSGVSGVMRNIKFGSNSHGNTIYALPFTKSNRQIAWNELTYSIDAITNNLDAATSHQIPLVHLYYGWGWRREDEIWLGDKLGVEAYQWPVAAQVIPAQFGLPNIHTIEPENACYYGDIDFGENFIGNVFFGAFRFQTERTPQAYYYVDNAYLSQNMDGVLSEVKFEKQNLYNIFLHGLSRCNIGSSVGNVFEGLYRTDIKQSNYSFFRDVYWSNFETSRYNSIYHGIAIDQTGTFAHNYLDNFVSNTIKDAFAFNIFAMQEAVPTNFSNGEISWPNGSYYQNFGNTIGPNFMHNDLRGYTYLTDFGSWVTGNRGTLDGLITLFSGFIASRVNGSFSNNWLPYDGPIVWTEFQSHSCTGKNFGAADILPTFSGKEVKCGNDLSSFPFGLTANPLLVIYDYSTGFPDIHIYGSGPYPNF
jgi:hypothetical protein